MRWIVRLASRYRVSLGVLLAPTVAAAIARWVLGDDPSTADVERLGYGQPALQGGRPWTLLTGAVVPPDFTASLFPSFSFVGVVLLEHRAQHWRTAVAFVGGQILGVLLALLLTWPLEGSSSAFAVEMTDHVDFGYSVGGFAALGMWTCYLSAPWRRPIVVGVSLYLAAQLLFSGLIFDVSHPIGWLLGAIGGRWLMHPHQVDRSRASVPADVAWIAVGALTGATVGVVAAWNAGGIGGVFGWGPS